MNAAAKTTWVLVADSARARLFEVGKRDGGPALFEIDTFVNPEGRGHHPDQDRLPRVHESANSAHHAIEPHTTRHDKAVDRFLGELNASLENGRTTHRYQRLVLVALPHLLGKLHAKLDRHVCECIVAEIPHELTTQRADEICSHLPERVCGEST